MVEASEIQQRFLPEVELSVGADETVKETESGARPEPPGPPPRRRGEAISLQRRQLDRPIPATGTENRKEQWPIKER